jgi:hypothetical protein
MENEIPKKGLKEWGREHKTLITASAVLFFLFITISLCLITGLYIYEWYIKSQIFVESADSLIIGIIAIFILLSFYIFTTARLVTIGLPRVDSLLDAIHESYGVLSLLIIFSSFLIFGAFGVAYFNGHNTPYKLVFFETDVSNGSSSFFISCPGIYNAPTENIGLSCELKSTKDIFNLTNISMSFAIDDIDYPRNKLSFDPTLYFRSNTLAANNSSQLDGSILLLKPGKFDIIMNFTYLEKNRNSTKDAVLSNTFNVISKKEADEKYLNLIAITLAIIAFPITIMPSILKTVRDLVFER